MEDWGHLHRTPFVLLSNHLINVTYTQRPREWVKRWGWASHVVPSKTFLGCAAWPPACPSSSLSYVLHPSSPPCLCQWHFFHPQQLQCLPVPRKQQCLMWFINYGTGHRPRSWRKITLLAQAFQVWKGGGEQGWSLASSSLLLRHPGVCGPGVLAWVSWLQGP
jgi:hypothetical protein